MDNMVLLLLWIVLLGFVFAKVEIQIEGKDGWAASLPTWRVEKHRLLDIFWGGRPMTGYHAWMFLFMALAFHLPLFLNGGIDLATETRIIGSLALFWIVEDFLWFVLNPAYGLRRFRPEAIAWHKRWIGPVPTDYVAFVCVGLALVWFSYQGW
jgi:hypothetical protein